MHKYQPNQYPFQGMGLFVVRNKSVIIWSVEQATGTDEPPEDQKSLFSPSVASDFKWQ